MKEAFFCKIVSFLSYYLGCGRKCEQCERRECNDICYNNDNCISFLKMV